MTIPAVQFAIDCILNDEGGVADVGDGKGVTRFGQTPQWLEDHGFVPPSNAGDAAVNYEAWMLKTGLAEICLADAFVGYLVTDAAVHAGLQTAIKLLQRALGVPDDGALGPKTRAALTALAGHPHLSRAVLAERIKFIGDLLASTKTDRRKWARGWANRLARQVLSLP